MTPEDVETVAQFLAETTAALESLGDWDEETYVTDNKMVISFMWDGSRTPEEVDVLRNLFVYGPYRNEILATLLLTEAEGS